MILIVVCLDGITGKFLTLVCHHHGVPQLRWWAWRTPPWRTPPGTPNVPSFVALKSIAAQGNHVYLPISSCLLYLLKWSQSDSIWHHRQEWLSWLVADRDLAPSVRWFLQRHTADVAGEEADVPAAAGPGSASCTTLLHVLLVLLLSSWCSRSCYLCHGHVSVLC
jgi:hypothetical protein